MFISPWLLHCPYLWVFHYPAIFENVLCIRLYCCATLNPTPFLDFFVPIIALVLHLLHFPANFLNVLRNRCSVAPLHNPLCSRSLILSRLFSLVNHLYLLSLLQQNAGLGCLLVLTTALHFVRNFLLLLYSAVIFQPSHLALCISHMRIFLLICVLFCLGPLFYSCQKLLSP